jgi:hypothetical protein
LRWRSRSRRRASLDRALGPDAPSTAEDRDYGARLLLVVVMGLAHLDTLDSELIGDADWMRYLEAGVGRLLGLPPAADAAPRAH